MSAKKKVKTLAPKLIKQKLGKLKGERGAWNSHWQEIADHILPRKNTIISQKTDGSKRNFQLLDNTGMHANELLAGTLHGLLTNPNSEWFELTTGDLKLDQDDDVREWLQNTGRALHAIINSSNFQTEIHELYLDICAFGTGCILVEEDEDDIIRFSTKFIAEYFIWENNQGIVDGIIREWKWTADKIVAEFGEKEIPDQVEKAYKKGTDEKFTCIHAVYDSRMVEGYENKNKKEYISQYIIGDFDYEISAGTFNEFPYLVPRWTKASGETYGRSPGMNALPDIKVLNKMNETMLIGAQRFVDPPLQAEDDGVVLPIITTPGGLNYRRPGSDPIRPIFNDTRVDFGQIAMEDRRKRVRDAYFVDQMRLQQGGPMMTATEVLQRTEDSVRFIGPMMGRQQTELAAPLVGRVYRIARDRKVIPQPPALLKGRAFSVRYSSLIAKAQRATDGQSIMRFLQAATPFIQLDPSAANYIDASEAIKLCAYVFGPPTELIRKDRDVQARQQAQAQAQQQAQAQAQQAQDTQQFSSVAQTLGDLGKQNG